MINNSFYSFLFLLLFKHRSKHIAIFIISTLIIFLLSSIMFVSTSLSKDIQNGLEDQPDFVVQKMNAGQVTDISTSLVDDISEILGVSEVSQRVYGKYYFKPLKEYFVVVGVDFFDEQNTQNLKKLANRVDIEKLFEKEYMIVGNGVKKLFEKFKYDESYFFELPDGSTKEVFLYDTLPADTNLIANDMIIVNMDTAKKILGIAEDKATDIALNVKNELERPNVKVELILKDNNLRVIQKEDVKAHYLNIFSYKTGLFLVLYIVVIVTFLLVLYQRYTMINSTDKKEIAILKAVGWSIKDILKLKVYENLIVGFFSFSFGLILAFFYIFIFDAPLFVEIFLGFSNLHTSYEFTPYLSMGSVVTLFVFYMVPFICAILFPVWKIATIDVMKSIR